jgi:hypothetical protein
MGLICIMLCCCAAVPVQSKSTPLGAVVKFAAGGKARAKKDLAMLAMETYGQDVYVASVCLEANYNQVRFGLIEPLLLRLLSRRVRGERVPGGQLPPDARVVLG